MWPSWNTWTLTVTSTDCISLLTFCGLSGAWTPMGVWMGFLLVVADLQDQILISKSFYISPAVSYVYYCNTHMSWKRLVVSKNWKFMKQKIMFATSVLPSLIWISIMQTRFNSKKYKILNCKTDQNKPKFHNIFDKKKSHRVTYIKWLSLAILKMEHGDH